MAKRPPYCRRKALPLKFTDPEQGRDLLGKYARVLYGDDTRPALLSLALLEAMLAEAAAISDPAERQSVLVGIHARVYDAAHGPQ